MKNKKQNIWGLFSGVTDSLHTSYIQYIMLFVHGTGFQCLNAASPSWLRITVQQKIAQRHSNNKKRLRKGLKENF
jgi:hypothetical protein